MPDRCGQVLSRAVWADLSWREDMMTTAGRGAAARRGPVWVVSDCVYARCGLAATVRADAVSLSCPQARERLRAGGGALPSRVLLYVGRHPDARLRAVRVLTALYDRPGRLPDVVVLGERTETWLYPTLMLLAGRAAVAQSLRGLPARLSVVRLQRTLSTPSGVPLMSTLTGVCDGRAVALTPRERQTLALTLAGVSVADQAQRLGLAVRTVYFYRYRAVRKLDVSSRRRGQQQLWCVATLVCGSGCP